MNFDFHIYTSNWARQHRLSLMSYQSVTMSKSVKLFQAAQQYMQITGIYPPQPGQIHSINTKTICFLFCLVNVFGIVASFFVFKAKTSVEFSISFYCSVTLLTIIGLQTISICQSSSNFEMLKSMEEFIETSKSIQLNLPCKYTRFNCISHSGIESSKSTFSYSKLIKNIELLSEIIYLALVKVTIPFNMVPALLISLFNYYARDMGDESFYLPFPVMYAVNMSQTKWNFIQRHTFRSLNILQVTTWAASAIRVFHLLVHGNCSNILCF